MIFDFLESGESIQTIASEENYDGLFWHAKGGGCSVYIDEKEVVFKRGVGWFSLGREDNLK